MFSINSADISQEKKHRGKNFLKGTFILTVASLVVKVIGSLNWIFVSRILGGEGIGLYQMAFPIYFLALTVSTAGVPVAISIVTAEKVALDDIYGAKRVFHVSMSFMFFTGIFFSLLTFFGASWLIQWGMIKDPRAYYSIIALAPAIFFVTILASSRGYLQGWQRMTPTAISQIAEQILRVITMILFANLLLPYGIQYAAAGASLGAFAGAIAGLLVLFFYHWQLNRDIKNMYQHELKMERRKQETIPAIIKRIAKLALPVSASSLMLPIVANLDLLIVPARLSAAGFSLNEATTLFGYLTGMAVPLVNLATILTASLAISIVPAISEAKTLRDTKRCFNQVAAAMRISNFICFPAFVAVLVLAVPISTLIYNAPAAGPAVWVSSFSIVLLGLHQVSTGVLQGIGHPTIPMVNMIIAAVAKVGLNWYLTAIPSLGIMGAAWATVADIGIAALINLYFLKRFLNYQMELGQLFKTIIAAIIMGGVVYFIYHYLMSCIPSNALATFTSLLIGMLIYIIVLILTGGIHETDIQRIPMLGKPSINLLKKIGLLKN